MKKIIGYIISVVGLIGIFAYTFPQVKTTLSFLNPFTDNVLLISSLIIIFAGLFITMKGGSTKIKKEVPIYKGKEIVGYRRN